MRYLKTYENLNEPKYWIVKFDDDFECKLWKIGAPDDRFDFFRDESIILNYEITPGQKIIILIDETFNWGWDEIKLNHEYKKTNKYMGEVNVTDEDRENFKLYQAAKKYNL